MLTNSDNLFMHCCWKSVHNKHKRRLVEAELHHHPMDSVLLDVDVEHQVSHCLPVVLVSEAQ
jgi:hypothetical protein